MIPVLGVKATVFCRSTEDPEKVKKALLSLFPFPVDVDVQEIRGMLGNVFYMMSAEVRKKSLARKVWRHVWDKLPEEDREYLRENVEKHVDPIGRLHLRFDKEAAYLGELRLAEGGRVVKAVFRLEAYPATPEEFAKAARKLVGI